jgi:O-antigen/teichoic acid export membrane protein
LPKSNVRARFQKNLLFEVLPFATGVAASGVLSTILSYADKIVLANLVTLEKFAYYGIATTIGQFSIFLVGPIYAAVFPRLTQLVAKQEQDNLRSFYHNCCQFLSAMVLPVTVVIALFSSEIIQIWIRDPTITSQTYLIVSILTVGSCINAFLWMPMGLQLANAWTRLVVTLNIFQVILIVPLLIVLTTRYDVTGAASAWLILNLGSFLISPYFTHKRFLKGELKRWYLKDIGYPFASAFTVAVLWRIVLSWQAGFMQMSIFMSFAELVLAFVSTWTVTALIVPITRQFIAKYVVTVKNKLNSSI